MDVAPDGDLYDFIKSLDIKERKEGSLQDTQTRVEKEKEEEEETKVWQDIADALDNWSGRILDGQILHEISENVRCDIETSLYRQQLNGFLSTHDISIGRCSYIKRSF